MRHNGPALGYLKTPTELPRARSLAQSSTGPRAGAVGIARWATAQSRSLPFPRLQARELLTASTRDRFGCGGGLGFFLKNHSKPTDRHHAPQGSQWGGAGGYGSAARGRACPCGRPCRASLLVPQPGTFALRHLQPGEALGGRAAGSCQGGPVGTDAGGQRLNPCFPPAAAPARRCTPHLAWPAPSTAETINFLFPSILI